MSNVILRLRSPLEQVNECDRLRPYTELRIRSADCKAAHDNNRKMNLL